MLYWNVLDTNAVLRYFTVNSGVTSLDECKQLCASHGSCVGIEYNEGTTGQVMSGHVRTKHRQHAQQTARHNGIQLRTWPVIV